MPDVASVMAELKSKGSEKTRITYARHGMDFERVYGVSVADLKLVAKSLKGQQELALGLYATGVMEAMYLAGMVAKGSLMSREQLIAWAEGSAGMQMIAEYTVPWVTVEHPEARSLAMAWIASETEYVATSGWTTYSGLAATKADGELDLAEIEGLLSKVEREIHGAPNRVRYTMNGFVISVGSYVTPLMAQARAAARRIGKVTVEMGDTACKVPAALEYMGRVEAVGKLGTKRKTIRC